MRDCLTGEYVYIRYPRQCILSVQQMVAIIIIIKVQYR